MFDQTEAGGTLRLTCGAFGSGKTYLTVKDVEDAKKSGIYRKIYSNIRGHASLCEGITELPEDWRDCEPYSLIIIDEVQSYEKFSLYFSKRKDEEIVDITMMRHNHHDIWMTSPDPGWVNTAIRKLVNNYIYLEATGKKTSQAWCFTRAKNEVTKSIKQTCYDEFTFTIEDKYYSLYMSTKDGQSSGRAFHRNWKLIGFVAGLCLVLFIAMMLVSYLMNGTKQNMDEIAGTAKPVETKPSNSILRAQQVTQEDCRKGENVDKPECVEFYKNLGKSSADNAVYVHYDPNKPYDVQLPQDYQVKVVSFPKISGAITMPNGSCKALDQRGNTMADISQADCKKWLNGHIPFDYSVSDKNDNGLMGAEGAQAFTSSLQENKT